MSKRKLQWEIVPEFDDEETGEHNGWYAEINHEKWGKYVWITATSGGECDVEVAFYYGMKLDEMKVLATCKSLTGAKRWVAVNLVR